MRFAIKTSPQHVAWQEVLDFWVVADGIDVFESGWTFDHFYPLTGDLDGPCLEGWVTLAALAQATTRLRLGVLVTGIHYRHPAVLANMAATLDIISNGRLEVGIGAGWYERESEAYGIPLGSPRERSDRFEEACEVLVGLLSNETTDFDGQYFQLRGARCEPKGPQRPHPPICIGGSGEQRTLRTTARFADHWNCVRPDPDEFRHKLAVLHGHCEDVGRDPAQIMTSVHVPAGAHRTLDEIVADAATMQATGVDLAILQFTSPLDPAVLEPLADRLATL